MQPLKIDAIPAEDLDQLIVCPTCDALYVAMQPAPGERAVCERCHHVLITPKKGAFFGISMLAIAVLVLLVGATFFPFLKVEVAGLSHGTSVFDAILIFSGAHMIGMTMAVAMLIVFVPLCRVLLILYVLAPVLLDRPLWPGARRAFLLFEELRPWSMAEIFVIGVVVALVKIAALAHIDFEPAFWLFAALVIVTVWQDLLVCRWSIWDALEQQDAE